MLHSLKCDNCGSTVYAEDQAKTVKCGCGEFIRKKPVGLGDTIHKILKPIAKLVGKSDCGSCNSRRQKLNQMFPYRSKP